MRISRFFPDGINYLLNCRKRLNALGLPGRLSLQRKYRQALESSLIDFIPRHIINSPGCLVDVGANVGEWCIAWALLTPENRIIAFEPVPESFSVLKKNTQFYPQIKCINLAVGSQMGKIKMNVESHSKLSSVLEMTPTARNIFGVYEAAPNVIIVSSTTLDNELHEFEEIAILKLDVQGYEVKVIEGAREVLKRTRVLITEVTYTPCYVGDMQIESLINKIESTADFKLWGITAPKLSSSGQPIFADAIFVQSSL